MPRKKRVSIDPTEPSVAVGTILPASVVDHLEYLARKRLSTKAQYVREAVIARLHAEGEVAEENEAEEIGA